MNANVTSMILSLLAISSSMICDDQAPCLLDWKQINKRGEDANLISSKSYALSEGSFQFSSNIFEDPILTAFWITPVDRSGNPSSFRAQNIVYYFHQPGNLDFKNDPLFRALAKDAGFTVLGVRFSNSSDPKFYPDQTRFYSFDKSGSFSAIINAINLLREHLKIPKEPIYLFGYSAGGIGVQRFAEEYPEMCGGVISYCGHSFIEKRRAQCPFLIVHNCGDDVESGIGLERFYRRSGNPVIRLIIPPVWETVERDGIDGCHCQNRKLIDDLVLRFFISLADLRKDHPSSDIHDISIWPYAISVRDPRIVTSAQSIANKNFASEFSDISTMVPSDSFYSEIIRIPPDPYCIDLAANGIAWIATPAATVTPKDVVIIQEPGTFNREGGKRWDFRDIDIESSLQLRFCASEGHKTIVIGKEDFMTEADLHKILGTGDASDKLPRCAIAFMPDSNGIKVLSGLNGMSVIVIIVDANSLNALSVPLLRKIIDNGIHINLLINSAPMDLTADLRSLVKDNPDVVRYVKTGPRNYGDRDFAHLGLLRSALQLINIGKSLR